MRDTKQCSPLSKKVVNFLFLVVLQSFLLGQCDKAKISSERSSPATINSVDTTSTNSVGSDSGSVGDLGSIEENEKVDDQSDKSKEPCDKIENQLNTKKLLLQCKARWDRVKKKSESSQKKEIQALSPSEAKGFLENAMTTDDISLFKKILKHRMPVPFTSEDLLEVLNNVVPRSPLPELSQKISQKFREMATILLQLLNQHNVSKELLYKPDLISGRTAFHYFAICADIDIWERLLKQLKEMKIGLDCLSIPDWNRQTPLHYLASLGCPYFIWESILGELIKDSTNKFMLSLQDKTRTTPLHYIVQKHYKNNILEIILGIISENDLSLEDKDGRTPLHLLFLTQQQHSKIEDFKILFIQIRDKLGCDLVVDTLLKKDKKRNSVIGCSYLPQDSNSNTLLEKIIGTAFPSKIGFNKNISKGKAMLSCILDFLPCVLNKSQLGIIAREIEDKVEDKSISQEYANKLCAIIGKYIDKNYGNEAKKVREYVAHARHLDPQSLSHDVDHDEGYCSS